MGLPLFFEGLPVVEEVVSVSSVALTEMLSKINLMTTLFQAIGGFVLAYVIFNIISIILAKKKNQELVEIKKLLTIISKKINK